MPAGRCLGKEFPQDPLSMVFYCNISRRPRRRKERQQKVPLCFAPSRLGEKPCFRFSVVSVDSVSQEEWLLCEINRNWRTCVHCTTTPFTTPHVHVVMLCIHNGDAVFDWDVNSLRKIRAHGIKRGDEKRDYFARRLRGE